MTPSWTYLATPRFGGASSYDQPVVRLVHTGHTGHTCFSNIAGAGAHTRAHAHPHLRNGNVGDRGVSGVSTLGMVHLSCLNHGPTFAVRCVQGVSGASTSVLA